MGRRDVQRIIHDVSNLDYESSPDSVRLRFRSILTRVDLPDQLNPQRIIRDVRNQEHETCPEAVRLRCRSLLTRVDLEVVTVQPVLHARVPELPVEWRDLWDQLGASPRI